MASHGAPPLLTNEAIVDDAVLYAQRVGMQPMLAEYMKRILAKRPKDPLAFLISEIAVRPYAPPTFPEDNPFFRDAAADGAEAVALVRRGGLPRFFRDCAPQCLARARAAAVAVAGLDAPSVLAHGDACVDNLVQTRSGVSLSGAFDGAGDAPYCVDVCRALASVSYTHLTLPTILLV